jgi:hypothetical protein
MADVTPDGQFLVFASSADLTPDDTSSTRQVFEYDAQSGSLVRVSIGQDGFNHDGNVPVRYDRYGRTINNAIIAAADYGLGAYQPAAYSTQLSVSADGSYVFFQSIVGLTPQAFNEQVVGEEEGGVSLYANNVYEYHDGHVSLISNGQDVSHLLEILYPVELLTTDLSGDDVLFTTTDRLVGQAANTSLNIYDARIDGGFLPPAQPAACSGEACQGPLSAAPTLLSPGSEFQAGGNPPLSGEPMAQAKSKGTGNKAKAKGKGKARRGAGGSTKRRTKLKGAARGRRMGGRS